MSIVVTVPVVADLTESTVEGAGVFDLLMRANKAHLEQEFSKNRIKGSEYATVYLGSMQAVMEASLKFLLERQKVGLDAELIQAQILQVQAQTALLAEQTLNAIAERDVLIAQKCKLQAEFDLLVESKLKSAQETALLAQKVLTERAQTQALGVDGDSVVGKQKALYQAQTDGFTRDAEQKVAKVMVDSWNVRRTTDEDTVADTTNKLSDTFVGRAVDKLLTGVGA